MEIRDGALLCDGNRAPSLICYSMALGARRVVLVISNK